MMKRYSQTIIVLLLCLLLAACFRHQTEGGESKAELRNSGIQSRQRGDQGDSGGPLSSAPAEKHERLQGFTFLVPDNWKTEPAEYGLSLIDNEYPKGGFFLRVMYGQKDDEYQHTPSEEIAELLGKSVEKMVEKDIGVNETKLVESKTFTINGLHTTVFRYSYSSKLQNGDAIQALFNRDSETFWMNGLFPYPAYAQLESDIRRIIESVRRE